MDHMESIEAQLPEAGNLPFPATTKQASGEVGGVLTDVMAVTFSDKILVTITQNGRLAQWVWKIMLPLLSLNMVLTIL